LDFPATSVAVHRLPGWPSRSPEPRGDRLPDRPRPPGLRPTFGAPAPRRPSLRHANVPSPTCLSWEFVFAPLRRHAFVASTPAGVAASFGLSGPPSRHVPPSWFLTTSTVSSATEVAGLLHPAADHGVRRVSRIRGRRTASRETVGREALPATRFIPLEESPSSAAVPCHHGRCLPAVTRPTTDRRSGPPKWTPTPAVGTSNRIAAAGRRHRPGRLQGLAPPTSP
jgi:hypothetical protein